MNQTIASVDIGTNTVLLTIADVSPSHRTLQVLEDIHSIARLGQNVDSSGVIHEDSILRAQNILEKYRTMCEDQGVSVIKAVGTSCLRDASNRQYVCERLSDSIGTQVEVISGDEEARLCFLGTVENDFPATIVDIGGGSTEIISGKDGVIEFRMSIDMGAVRLTERYLKKLPATNADLQCAVADIQNALSSLPDSAAVYDIRAVAGTPTTLAAMVLQLTQFEATLINNYQLSYTDIDTIARKLSELSIDEIVQLPGVHPKRADILLAGVLILKEIMKFAGKTSCSVSTKGLRYGVLKQLAESLYV